MPRYSQQEQADALAELRKQLSPGDMVCCILRHVSKSGMLRVISFQRIKAADDVRMLDYNVARVLGMTHDREREGLRVSGAGMDMGFAVVYDLSRALFPNGFGEMCNKPECGYRAPNEAELAHVTRFISEPWCIHGVAHSFRGRNGDTSGWDNDGGYALKHRWL